MLKLHQYFLRSTLWIVIASFFITIIFSYYFAKDSEIDRTKSSLKNILSVVALQSDLSDTYLKKLSQRTKARVTYIDKIGKVLFDSKHNPKDMDSHLSRPEIQEAKNRGFGESVRYSDTLKRELIYVAKKLDSGYLRVAYGQQSIYNKVIDMMVKKYISFPCVEPDCGARFGEILL